MKTLNLIYVLMMITTFTISSCESKKTALNENLAIENALSVIESDNALIQSISGTGKIGTLSTEEQAGLFLMREEEKMAHDVYVYFYNLYQHRIFSNISKSETQHTEAVLRLINFYGLIDPATNEVGVFNNAEIQTLYNKLIAQGTSLVGALTAGAYIEEYDIKDIQKLLAQTDNTNIKRVYSNLLKGSINHLKAFTRVLKMKGVTYVPTILSQEEYNALISK